MASLRLSLARASSSSGAASLPLLFLLFLSVVAAVLGFLEQCPPCGNRTVPYPFSTASGCGHPLYRLGCSPSHSQLQFMPLSTSYAVRDISPASQLITVVPAPLLSHANSCISDDFVHGGLLLDSSQPFTVTPANTLLLFNCTKLMLGSPLNCSASSPCHKAALASRSSPCQPLLCCTLAHVTTMHILGYRVNESACSAYTGVVNLNESLPGEQWNYGVQLHWGTPEEPPCANRSECPRKSQCTTDGSDVGVCRCNSGYEWSSSDGLCKKGYLLMHRTALISGLTSSLLALSVILSFAFCYLYKKRKARQLAKATLLRERSLFLNSNGGKATLFTAKEMRLATDNYKNDRLLGRGGFGDVYKGVLRDGTPVAIKVARVGNVKGSDQVLNEVRILSQVNHRNLVRLLGCCLDAEQPILVYEYVPNGTLFHRLNPMSTGEGDKRSRLSWERRLRIANEIANGLSYLHSFAHPPIIHRDVKSANILLDANLTAKVSDFGLSRFLEDDVTHISTCAQGTVGYLDPYYYHNYQLTDKSDVYSFGVVLLELITSQPVIDFTREEENVNLAEYVCRRCCEGCLDKVFDPMLVYTASESEIECMMDLAILAIRCSDEDSAGRPRMTEVAHRIDCMLRQLQKPVSLSQLNAEKQ